MIARWAGVWRPRVLGQEWMEAYGYRGKSSGAAVLMNVPQDRPHPRVVLPLAVLTWASGQAATPSKAAGLVASRSLEETLAQLPERVALPVPCASEGRCPATVVAGRLTTGWSGDRAEDVARALLHRGACSAEQQPPPRVDQLSQWLRTPFQPLAVSALRIVDSLQTSTDPVTASQRAAGWVKDEEELRERWSRLQVQPSYGFARWKSGYPRIGTTSCPLCNLVLWLPGSPCPICSTYPAGPSKQDTVLDRLDVALGVCGRGA